MLEEFYNIFGPELKAVTGDPKRIEEVLVRVDALVTPLEEVHNMQTGLCSKFIWIHPQNHTKSYVIYPSYEMDQDFWGCFGN